MTEKPRTRTPYTPQEKAEIVLAVLTRKTTIQKIAKERNIAATLVSLWKKQAEDAIHERFASSKPGRRKAEVSADDVKEELRAARVAARTSKTRATRLEAALKKAKTRAAELEAGTRELAAIMGCKLVKSDRVRRKKA